MKYKISCMLPAVLLCLTGCGETDEQRILHYLEQKYHEEFIVYHIRRTSDGSGTYRMHAECAPAAHPDILFGAGGTKASGFGDSYSMGIRDYEAAESMYARLEGLFETYAVVLNVTTVPAADGSGNRVWFMYDVAVDADADSYASAADEYDTLLDALAEASDEYESSGQINLHLFPHDFYLQYTEWCATHKEPLANNLEGTSYAFAYDAATHQLAAAWLQKEPYTKEMYLEERTQNQTGEQ